MFRNDESDKLFLNFLVSLYLIWGFVALVLSLLLFVLSLKLLFYVIALSYESLSIIVKVGFFGVAGSEM